MTGWPRVVDGLPAPIEFSVDGVPGTKGSVRAFGRRIRGKFRAVVVNDAAKKAKPWAEAITWIARSVMRGAPPYDGPVRVEITFYLKRPKDHFTKKGLRPDAPVYVATKPDGDKLLRCAWDAMTAVIFKDDSLIVSWSGDKFYSDDGRTGAHFKIMPAPQVRGVLAR